MLALKKETSVNRRDIESYKTGPRNTESKLEPRGYRVSREMELKYAEDPLELAKFVSDRLSKGHEKEMLDLVRLASKKGISCVVSWNHLINHEFLKGRLNNAYKIYNEMKKRGQSPDAFTYTILLRGYAEHAHVRNVLGQALSIYHSMSAPNSKVPPSVIHTNAALKVCVRANNSDAVWSIAAKIPDGGPNAANALTFTTILNFLRQNALINGPEGETEEQATLRRERAIVDGRRIWVDVAGKWSASQLKIDEELVCAMGRLLLIGSRPRDWDDVLSLLAQTMDIPRLVPRLGTRNADGELDKATKRLLEREPEALREVELEAYDPETGPSRGAEFLPLNQKTVGGGKAWPLLYVTPGNNTLSVIQEACLKIIANQESTTYWNLLTDSYGIKPDLNNLNMRLRIIRQNRASREAVELIENDLVGSDKRPTRGTFRIAMSVCKRDKNNPSVLDHAGRILDVMTSTLADADAKTSSAYADLVFLVAPNSEAIKIALLKLEPVLASIKIQLGVGKDSGAEISHSGPMPLTAEERTDAMETIRSIYRLYERIVLREEMADDERRPYIEGRSRLSALLNRLDYVLRRKAAALRETTRNQKQNYAEMPPEEDEDDEGGIRQSRKKIRARDRKDDVEVFEAWEDRYTEIRGRASKRATEPQKEVTERRSRRDGGDQWNGFDHRGKGREYREGGTHFGVAL
ncbi:uncharacterized protein BDZ99DRAFT_378812 [Mytilinidion resinicola]|uniref:Pentatricopeptide repeat protein n=1 Tax=Mytilinidion resinicola TaxID=574789 RepID=A0A6A6Z3E7_9PEZI|nr:uncharacterized protein BDZ99DRAFT_378812 [Mytilinidion resinicola]KAF2814804.1 hypothetical protein BDZ99DRAFT_378812 [Mytilinidion resinicola]